MNINKAIEVLLIEDNPADAYLACEYLNDTGYFVLVTKLQDGKAAIDFFEQVHGGYRKMPDLVLLDLNLPKQNGQEVLEFTRRQDEDVTVVIYSGSTSPMDRQRAETSKVNGYLVKPMTGEEMDEVVFQLKKVLKTIDEKGTSANDPPDPLYFVLQTVGRNTTDRGMIRTSPFHRSSSAPF